MLLPTIVITNKAAVENVHYFTVVCRIKSPEVEQLGQSMC